MVSRNRYPITATLYNQQSFANNLAVCFVNFQAFNHKEPCRKQQCPGRLRYEKRKTTMCPDYMRQNRCIFGEDCQYAHSQAEIRQLPKHELCSKYLGGATCLRSSEVCLFVVSTVHFAPYLTSLSSIMLI